jgi:hypothetical protein
MFLQNCIIEKTYGIIDCLKELGYKFEGDNKGLYIQSFKDGICKMTENKSSFKNIINIDCTGHPKLFLAIAAMRKDSDYKQWFKYNDGDEWYCHVSYTPSGKDDAYKVLRKDKWHKATLEELIENFNHENIK